jgi:hypothetical protein
MTTSDKPAGGFLAPIARQLRAGEVIPVKGCEVHDFGSGHWCRICLKPRQDIVEGESISSWNKIMASAIGGLVREHGMVMEVTIGPLDKGGDYRHWLFRTNELFAHPAWAAEDFIARAKDWFGPGEALYIREMPEVHFHSGDFEGNKGYYVTARMSIRERETATFAPEGVRGVDVRVQVCPRRAQALWDEKQAGIDHTHRNTAHGPVKTTKELIDEHVDGLKEFYNGYYLANAMKGWTQ